MVVLVAVIQVGNQDLAVEQVLISELGSSIQEVEEVLHLIIDLMGLVKTSYGGLYY